MLVLAAVPDVQFHKLRRAAGSRFSVAQASTWDDVLASIRGRPVELAVVDPLLSGHPRSQEIERLRVLFPSLPLMLYTTLTPRTAGEMRLSLDADEALARVVRRFLTPQAKAAAS